MASVSESGLKQRGGNETLAGTGCGGGEREDHLVQDVRVGLQRDPPLPHLLGARRGKSKAGGERTGRLERRGSGESNEDGCGGCRVGVFLDAPAGGVCCTPPVRNTKHRQASSRGLLFVGWAVDAVVLVRLVLGVLFYFYIFQNHFLQKYIFGFIIYSFVPLPSCYRAVGT